MGVNFTNDAAKWILENADWAGQQPRNPTQPNDGSNAYPADNVGLFEIITTFSVHTGEHEYRGQGKLVVWDTTANKFLKLTITEQDLWYSAAKRDGTLNPTSCPTMPIGSRAWCVYRGRWEVVQQAEASSEWQWVKATTNCFFDPPRACIHKCDDYTGANPQTAIYTVYLTCPKSKQVAVYTNQIFLCHLEADGVYACDSQYDDPIGSMRPWAYAADNVSHPIPTGWEICTGAGGLGLDMRGYYPVGYKAGDAYFGTLGGTLGDTTATVPQHNNHHHTIAATVELTPGGNGGINNAAYIQNTSTGVDNGGTANDYRSHGAIDILPPSRVINWIVRTF